jgi:parvulin-like peptidyl-prolyl isomerase
MTDKDNVGTPEEESNIDQINQLITNSKETEPYVEMQPEIVNQAEESKTEDQASSENKSEVKKTETKLVQPKTEKSVQEKPQQKTVQQPKTIQKQAKKTETKKAAKEISNKKAEDKKIEKRPVQPKTEKSVQEKPQQKTVQQPKQVKKQAKKIEIKKAAKEAISTKAKKIFNANKSPKEEKMVNHKEHKEHKEKFRIKKNTLLWIGIGILAIILIVALILILTSGKSYKPVVMNETNNSVAAIVNGEPIYSQDIMKEYNGLSAPLQSVYTVEVLLNKSIDDMLLYQEAKNTDIKIAQEEIQSQIDAIKIQNKLTDTAFENALAQQNMTVKQAEDIIEKNLLIRKLLNATVLNNITVTDEQIKSYYDLNIDQFKVAEKVTVQHILVLVTDNFTDDMAKAKIEKIQKELNATNFCDLVAKYSEDPGSLSTCGKYTFARGEMVSEFENPSFNMSIGETTIVKTVYGYHLIKKLEAIPARTMTLSEASDKINTTIHDETAQKKFDALLVDLRAKASIINYMTKTDTNETIVNTEKNLDDFAKCITASNATFYGASWCTHCNNQKDMFGSSLQYVNYVECAVEGQPNVQTKACTDAGISGYPTWIINGKSYPGEQTLANLAKLTGCTAPQ